MEGVKGTFTAVGGEGELGPDGSVTGTLTVAASSIDTKNARRGTHLKSKDFLSAADHPDMILNVISINPAADRVRLPGTLTAGGKTIPLSFPATLAITANTAALDAALTIDRSELGLTWNRLGMASMKFDLTAHLVFTHA